MSIIHSHLRAAGIAVAFVLLGSVTFCEKAHSQQFDYQTWRGSLANQTADQINTFIQTESNNGFDLFFAVPDIHTGDTIAIFRRPHVSTAPATALKTR